MKLRRSLRRLLRNNRLPNYVFGRAYYIVAALTRGYPARRDSEEIPAPFFIIGAARSGNTLLRALLVGHPQIAIPPESYVLPRLVEKWEHLSFLRWDDLVRVVIGTFQSHPEFFTWNVDLSAVYRKALAIDKRDRSLAAMIDLIYRHYATEVFPGARVWGDKTPFNTENYRAILRLFPQARYIHILRDGRDAVSSALEAGLFEGDVERASREWLLRVRSARELSRHVDKSRFLEVRYERLVADTLSVLQEVCNFLGLPFAEQMAAHEDVFGSLGDAKHYAHHANLARPITAESVGKWRQRLTDDQKAIVNRALGRELRQYGYG